MGCRTRLLRNLVPIGRLRTHWKNTKIGAKNAFKSEKQGRSQRLAESTHTKVVTANSSFYMYNLSCCTLRRL
jgi:hypothetical protein